MGLVLVEAADDFTERKTPEDVVDSENGQEKRADSVLQLDLDFGIEPEEEDGHQNVDETATENDEESEGHVGEVQVGVAPVLVHEHEVADDPDDEDDLVHRVAAENQRFFEFHDELLVVDDVRLVHLEVVHDEVDEVGPEVEVDGLELENKKYVVIVLHFINCFD